ncbi:unnamed protein product [Oncorhynchus mykiss]|uniref:Uncharacterized protein n=1 Tax=Oncorhynchus mykiss TaxID=8022 RepID=A0A060YEC5_ONCMY|nr:unnamed protein product [Oncorhynchus mykiss]
MGYPLKSLFPSQPSESSGEEWRREKRDLERKMMELQTSLQEERRGSVGSSDPVLKAELDSCLDENMQLQETVDRKKTELHQTHSELSQLRMERESAESRVREMEDRLGELQEELRTENGNKTVTQHLGGPGDVSSVSVGGVHVEAEAGGFSETEREGADGPEGSSEGRGGHARQRHGDTSRTVQH